MTNNYVSERQLSAYIKRNYPELADLEISVAVHGKYYRVIVTDGRHVNHTLKIPVSGPGSP